MHNHQDDQHIHVRIHEKALFDAITERAKRYKLSRNEWINKALQRVVDMPSQVTTRQERF